jgi:hypothetical protein
MADSATKKAAMKRKSSMTGKRKSKAPKTSTPTSASTPAAPRDPQPPNVDAMANLSSTQKDWLQREWIEHVNLDLKKIVEFLNIFGTMETPFLELADGLDHQDRFGVSTVAKKKKLRFFRFFGFFWCIFGFLTILFPLIESSTKNRLATVNTKLAHLERQMVRRLTCRIHFSLPITYSMFLVHFRLLNAHRHCFLFTQDFLEAQATSLEPLLGAGGTTSN